MFDCTPEAGFVLEMDFQDSEDCKLFRVRESLLDRAIRTKPPRPLEEDRGTRK